MALYGAYGAMPFLLTVVWGAPVGPVTSHGPHSHLLGILPWEEVAHLVWGAVGFTGAILEFKP